MFTFLGFSPARKLEFLWGPVKKLKRKTCALFQAGAVETDGFTLVKKMRSGKRLLITGASFFEILIVLKFKRPASVI